MPVLPFPDALERHAMLRDQCRLGTRPIVADIYAGITGAGNVNAPLARAVSDTMPKEYAVLLRLDDVAAAAATAKHAQAFAYVAPDTAPNQLRACADNGWKAFQELTERAKLCMRGTGADLSESWPIVVEVERLGVDYKKMRQIADLAGRMLVSLRGAMQRRAVPMPEETLGVELGSDVTALLPVEYALLSHPATKPEVLLRLTNRRAQQYERRAKEKKSRGALAILVDESSSMKGSGAEHRNIWAKSAATALTLLAWESKRPVVWIHFATGARVRVLKPGDRLGLIQAQQHFLDGGTDIPYALRLAAREIQRLDSEGVRGADAVLVSDGVTDNADSLPSAMDHLDAAGARLFSLAIEVDWRKPTVHGEGPYQRVYDCTALVARSATYVHLGAADMRSPEGATKLVGAVA